MLQTFKEMCDDESICNYCSNTEYGEYKSGVTPNGYWSCEGSWCKDAYEDYLDENETNDEITEYVGIAVDEPGRIRENSRTGVIKDYPLVDWGMTEDDCLTYCYNHGWNWDENGVELYSVLDRVSCWCC